MKTKDLIYIGIIAFLSYILVKKNKALQSFQSDSTSTESTETKPQEQSSNTLPNSDSANSNQTPSIGSALPASVSDSASPVIPSNNEPTQVFGSYNLPTPYTGSSNINPNPVDVVPPSNTAINSDIPKEQSTSTPIILNSQFPELPSSSSETLNPKSTTVTVISEAPVPTLPISIPPTRTSSLEPMDLGLKQNIVPETIKDDLIYQCGTNFSIPNNDREGSYTNYWIDRDTFYMQTTSPLIKTIATKITKDSFVEGCKRFQFYKSQNTRL